MSSGCRPSSCSATSISCGPALPVSGCRWRLSRSPSQGGRAASARCCRVVHVEGLVPDKPGEPTRALGQGGDRGDPPGGRCHHDRLLPRRRHRARSTRRALYTAGFKYPGHTEYLAALCRPATACPPMPVMMLAHEDLRVVPATIHVPLARVPGLVTQDLRRSRPAASWRTTCAPASASPSRASALPASTRMRAKAARSAPRISISSGPAVAQLQHENILRRGPDARRHAVLRAALAALRRGDRHVSRPGADPDQDGGVRSRR